MHGNENIIKTLSVHLAVCLCLPVSLSLSLPSSPHLAQQDVSDGSVDVLLRRIAAVNHQTVDELHRLRSLTAKLAGNNHFATLRCTRAPLINVQFSRSS